MIAALGAAFVAANHAELPRTWRALRSAHGGWLIAGILAMVAWFADMASTHAASWRAAGLTVRTRELMAPVMAATSLNLVVKSGGLAGLPAMMSHGRRHHASRGAVTAAYVLVSTMMELAFAAFAIVAVALLAVDHRLGAAEVAAAAAFCSYVLARLALIVSATRSRGRVRAAYAAPQRLWARLRRRPAPDVDHTAADELYDALQLVIHRPGAFARIGCGALVADAISVFELFVACRSIGLHVALSVAFAAYAVSALFGIITIVPGGLGFVELSLGAVLVSFGASAAAAAAVVVLYRMFELWLPLLAGLIASHRLRVSAAA